MATLLFIRNLIFNLEGTSASFDHFFGQQISGFGIPKTRLFIADYLRRLPLGFFTERATGTIDALYTTNIMYL
ncbi:MAG: hypothetical protein AAF723_02360, partial [Pseudomonadota bacterium]